MTIIFSYFTSLLNICFQALNNLQVANTGDRNNLIIPAIILIICLLAGFAFLGIRLKNNKKSK